ncbi:hypothetical protein PFICI_01513 [Pestalotiopsis fici W106-1]|uniref:Uncharacterized protein n=1 Tax=Pestalotiopsis fici (strain W106-1 / CGMCC3.15140) TaxID=1229662 RepID=W3XNZ2_PESFW|nr:uncharacterized protein PFICI_01513 [Pestalotiopsis fici W106-1]ETS87685.1 hypothetical protein PFICI_01513 [Pestalotiopsis fici W106-1]
MPRTPEPANAGGDEELLSYPRPRLRLRKRNASSQLRAASHHEFVTDATAVTAVTADTPLPSIETSDSATAFATPDEHMVDYLPAIHLQHGDNDDNSLRDPCPISTRIGVSSVSRPQTPTVDLAPSYKASAKFPNWSIDSSWSDSDLESSPEYESSRPSTAFSTQTSSSLFSHFSQPSEDGDCISPDVDKGYFNFADWHGNDNNGLSSSRAPRKAPWTRAMSSHLWSTYMLYLSDSTVTPVNMGKSCIPPNGVCARVAREAKRSWKGSKQMLDSNKSGSSTPTAESARPYIEWPHTCAATRAHLRELCKLRAAPAASNTAQSPAPFTKAAHRRWNRRSTPLRSPSVFSAQEMGMSLALSTSETMHPEGPMARLTRSVRESQNTSQPSLPRTHGLKTADQVESDPFVDSSSQASRMRLGSPFAKSYGPSSSSTLTEGIEPRRQSLTVGPPNFLKSPARLTRSGTQKRRSNKNSGKPRKRRPSLASVVWDPPAKTTDSSPNTSAGTQFSSTDSRENDKLFVPRTSTTGIFPPSTTSSLHEPAVPASIPARLGSPFSFPHASHSFPNRFTQPIHFNLGALRKPFATVHQTREPSPETSPTRAGLSSRLAYLDQRLKDLRNRTSRQKSQSPSI